MAPGCPSAQTPIINHNIHYANLCTELKLVRLEHHTTGVASHGPAHCCACHQSLDLQSSGLAPGCLFDESGMDSGGLRTDRHTDLVICGRFRCNMVDGPLALVTVAPPSLIDTRISSSGFGNPAVITRFLSSRPVTPSNRDWPSAGSVDSGTTHFRRVSASWIVKFSLQRASGGSQMPGHVAVLALQTTETSIGYRSKSAGFCCCRAPSWGKKIFLIYLYWACNRIGTRSILGPRSGTHITFHQGNDDMKYEAPRVLHLGSIAEHTFTNCSTGNPVPGAPGKDNRPLNTFDKFGECSDKGGS